MRAKPLWHKAFGVFRGAFKSRFSHQQKEQAPNRVPVLFVAARSAEWKLCRLRLFSLLHRNDTAAGKIGVLRSKWRR